VVGITLMAIELPVGRPKSKSYGATGELVTTNDNAPPLPAVGLFVDAPTTSLAVM